MTRERDIQRFPHPFGTVLRGLSLAACVVGIAAFASAARADDDDSTFRALTKGLGLEKLGEMTGLKKEEEKQGIEYRERSPLVIPRTRDLPPPESHSQANAEPANWPKQPPAHKGSSGRTVGSTPQPGSSDLAPVHTPMFDSSDWTWSAVIGKKKAESIPFKGEPNRQSLIQPPEGYQTPSPEYPYGTGGPPATEKTGDSAAAAPAAPAPTTQASTDPASTAPTSTTPPARQ
jgi:hypothetical protein